MNPLRTLRGRLAGAMLAILLLAIGASVTFTALEGHAPPAPPDSFDTEPYQDALVLASFALVSLALIWLVSSWSLRPLARVSQQAREMGPFAPSARLSPTGLPAEITPLVDAVNGALDRMAGAFAAERRFTENAAHELRTPLAVLGLRLQRARQAGAPPDWPAIEQDLAHMNRLVAQMLDLARKENAARGGDARKMINLARLAREACAASLPLLEAQGRSLAADLPETLNMPGDADDLRDAITNLLENAALHGAGTVRVAADVTDAGRTITLSVSDEGAGPPADMRGQLFERFAKGADSRGSGLGLAIVREVARAHGGDVAFMNRDGCGIAIRLQGK